ncbi:MAG: LacI family DNA-binding transcriptional regulator [Chloroflexi bacterium]|nr:LacI family DNA-binding transcriptional regulator [Chloroflexota bacterium]
MARVSIKTVAAVAGVSFQTASKVLNGRGSVSSATRERILGAAADLGYVPNALARSLVTRSTRTIGVVAADLSDAVLAQFVVGAEREARRHDLCVIIGSIASDGSDAGRYLRMLVERRVDGLFLAAPALERVADVSAMLDARLPVVTIHRVAGLKVSWAGVDQVRIGEVATSHLIEQGRRRIGTITGPLTRAVVHLRHEGFARALDTAGLPLDEQRVERADWEIDGGAQAALRLLERVPDLDAIFVHNDTMAIGALSALHARGRRVPDDCAVIGCDDIPAAGHTIPPLSTIHVPYYAVGAAAMQLLIEEIERPEGTSPEIRRVELPSWLRCRWSCGCGSGDRDATLLAGSLPLETAQLVSVPPLATGAGSL